MLLRHQWHIRLGMGEFPRVRLDGPRAQDAVVHEMALCFCRARFDTDRSLRRVLLLKAGDCPREVKIPL